jgi:2-polyprenyl-3-methyl-5-hydroxy-6-metoxy-1,4-benzoquinol methylase
MTDLIPLYKAMAAEGGNFHGMSVMQHAKSIGKVLKQAGAKTVLDYGCGRGDAYMSAHKVHQAWGLRRIDVTLYDPAFPQHSQLPGRRFDAVICSDVLEHIPEEDVDRFIGGLFNHAKRVVWASVCCREAKKTFPDGTNLHVTVRPLEWWRERFASVSLLFGLAVKWHLVETP